MKFVLSDSNPLREDEKSFFQWPKCIMVLSQGGSSEKVHHQYLYHPDINYFQYYEPG